MGSSCVGIVNVCPCRCSSARAVGTPATQVCGIHQAGTARRAAPHLHRLTHVYWSWRRVLVQGVLMELWSDIEHRKGYRPTDPRGGFGVNANYAIGHLVCQAGRVGDFICIQDRTWRLREAEVTVRSRVHCLHTDHTSRAPRLRAERSYRS